MSLLECIDTGCRGELLTLGRELGWPLFWYSEAEAIGVGRENWQAFAHCASGRRIATALCVVRQCVDAAA